VREHHDLDVLFRLGSSGRRDDGEIRHNPMQRSEKATLDDGRAPTRSTSPEGQLGFWRPTAPVQPLKWLRRAWSSGHGGRGGLKVPVDGKFTCRNAWRTAQAPSSGPPHCPQAGFCRHDLPSSVGTPWWATDKTRLTWADSTLVGAISHAIDSDFPHCCGHN
jgi:hypothetical protein